MLDIFRGQDPTRVAPDNTVVRVQNGTPQSGRAADAAEGLRDLEFVVPPDNVGDADSFDVERTTVLYIEGEEERAALIAQALAVDPIVEEGEYVVGADVNLIIGADWPGWERSAADPRPRPHDLDDDAASNLDDDPRLDDDDRGRRRRSRAARRRGLLGRSGTVAHVKGLILSGGAGTRLRPITHTSAKQLVPVANKPILFYGLEDMAAAGIREIGIVVGETADEIRAAVGDGSDSGVEVTYIPQDAPLGLAHGVLIARGLPRRRRLRHVPGRQHAPAGAGRLRRAVRARPAPGRRATLDGGDEPPACQILLCPVPDPQRFGVAEVGPGGEIVRLVEKPEVPAVRPRPRRRVPVRAR